MGLGVGRRLGERRKNYLNGRGWELAEGSGVWDKAAGLRDCGRREMSLGVLLVWDRRRAGEKRG
ncbi:MAG: hypothetical protein ACI8TQ_003266 [Planctomycetota bacterium]|jgi:hypothetical protein